MRVHVRVLQKRKRKIHKGIRGGNLRRGREKIPNIYKTNE